MRSALTTGFALATVFCSAVALPLGPGRAHAQECDLARREPLTVTPASGAGGVTLDAYLRIDYSACYFETTGDDAASLITLSLGGTPVPGRVERVEDTVFFVPRSPLLPSARYEGEALGVTRDLEFSFFTGSVEDVAPPNLGELESVTTARQADGSFRVDVAFPPATDDGPVGSIQYLLYLSRGEGLEAPELRATARSFVTELVTMAFILEADEVDGPVCVVVHAVDGVGRVDSDGEPSCFEPEMGSFFEGCSVSGGTTSPLSSGAFVAAVVALWRRRSSR